MSIESVGGGLEPGGPWRGSEERSIVYELTELYRGLYTRSTRLEGGSRWIEQFGSVAGVLKGGSKSQKKVNLSNTSIRYKPFTRVVVCLSKCFNYSRPVLLFVYLLLISLIT